MPRGQSRKAVQPRHGRASSDECGSTSDSENEDAPPRLDCARYQAAQLAAGLRQKPFRLAAVQELQAIFQQGLYCSADKRLQATVFEDLVVAAQQRDSRPQVREATSALLAAARHVLPQQKRQTLAKEHKQAAVAASRRRRGGTGHTAGGEAAAGAEDVDDDDEAAEEESCVVLGDVPLEVVGSILQALDPCSLAMAACVCRLWHELATHDDLWRANVHALFPRAARHGQQQPQLQQQQQQQQQPQQQQPQPQQQRHLQYAQLFGHEARRRPSVLLPWRSCRTLRHGKLEWTLPAGALGPGLPGEALAAVRAARHARQGTVPPGPLYITRQQAIKWMLRQPMRDVLLVPQPSSARSSLDGSSSSSGSSSSGDDDDGGGGGEIHAGARKLAALKLWAVGLAR